MENPMDNIQQSDKAQNEPLKKLSYPISYLYEQSEKIGEVYEKYFRVHRLPKEVFRLINGYVYMQTLIDYYKHPQDWTLGTDCYNDEIEGAIMNNAWLIEEIEEITGNKLQSMSDEERKAVSNYDLYH